MKHPTDDAVSAPGRVLHDVDTPLATALPSSLPVASCATCSAPLPRSRRGTPRPGVRFCSARCRFAEVRDRRAAARADLLAALGQLAEVTRRVESALRTLGLNPRRPRTRPRR